MAPATRCRARWKVGLPIFFGAWLRRPGACPVPTWTRWAWHAPLHGPGGRRGWRSSRWAHGGGTGGPRSTGRAGG